MKKDLSKQHLYEAVKHLVELEDKPHLHLAQQKLFTLFSIAFQYLLFCSTKKKGAYIIRVEDSALAEKLAKRSKDPSTRKFLNALMIPRKFKYHESTFYLDFFHIGSWNLTNDIPRDRIQAALIVKNTSSKPMEVTPDQDDEPASAEENNSTEGLLGALPENYFLTSLQEFVPKTITIAFEHKFDGLHEVNFPFIKKEADKTVSGVTLGNGINWDSLEKIDN